LNRTSQVIGIVGIGQPGLAIATDLMPAGIRVVGHRRPDRTEFVTRGGEAIGSPGEVARAADMALPCLPGDASQLDVPEGQRSEPRTAAPF
jgi:3-hydroxyisobutyrate dehydrogenase-like beta-hydroxyacid dehydrogenase